MGKIEQLSNQLSRSELKALIADRITIDPSSLTAFSEKVYVRAKILITKHMLEQNQPDFAIKFLKKAIFEHNRNFRLQAALLEKASKLTISVDAFSPIDFTQQVLRDVALDQVTHATFEQLKTACMIKNLPVQALCEIHEAKISTECF